MGATHGVGGNPPRVVTPPPGTMTVSVQPHVATPRATVVSGPPPQSHVHVAHTLPPLVTSVQQSAVGTNQPPPGGQYSLWSQPKFTVGQPPLVPPPFIPLTGQVVSSV